MAEVTRTMYREEKRYVMNIAQINADLIDADFNSSAKSFFNQIRRVQEVQGDGSPNNGFLVIGTDDDNTFMIKGGGGTNEDAGKLFHRGFAGRLTGDIMYLAGSPANTTLGGIRNFNPSPSSNLFFEDQFSIYPRVTSVSYDSGGNQTVITDSSANYTSDELVGRAIQVGLSGTVSSFTIASNTTNQIRINGDQTSSVNALDQYRLTLTTPIANRVDGVYVNFWLKEVAATEDPELYHVSEVGVLESQRRWQVEQVIHVVENDTGVFSDYQDSDGNPHYVAKIAEIARIAGDAQITDPMVTDIRRDLKPNDQIGFPTILQARAIPADAGGPSDYVSVEPGWYSDTINRVFVSLDDRAFSDPFNPITTVGNVRYDLLSLDRNGNLSIDQGTEVALPGDPYTTQFDVDKCSIAVIRITEDANVEITEDDITDYRDILLTTSSSTIDHQATSGKLGDSPWYHISQDKYDALNSHGGFAINASNKVANVNWVLSLLVSGQAVPTGAIFWFPIETPPTGYHICDGSQYKMNIYEDLYNIIGSFYGLAGETAISFNSSNHTLNATGHTLVNGDIIELTTSNALPSGLNQETKYYVVNSVAGVSFQVSSSAGGAFITFSGNGTGSHSVWTDFRVPDLGGLFVRSLDLGSGYDTGRGIGTFQDGYVPSHSHGINRIFNDADNGGAWSYDPPHNTDGSSVSGEVRPRNIALLPTIKY
jgi:hypothetical protein